MTGEPPPVRERIAHWWNRRPASPAVTDTTAESRPTDAPAPIDGASFQTASDQRLEALVDQLMPRQGPVWRRFAVGAVATLVVIAGGLAWWLGLIVPDYEGGRQLRR